MTQHINPGTDTTINPVVIDDSKRGKPRPPCEECIYQAKAAEAQQRIAAVIGELEAMEEKSTSNDIVSAGYRTGLRKAIAFLQAGQK